MGDLITLTINQWEKWNPRKDIKQPSWFALSNRIIEDDQMQTLTHAEFRAFIYLGCIASQQNKPTFDLNLAKAERVTGIKRAVMLKAIEKLAAYGICTRSERVRTDSVRDPYATLQDTTRQDKTKHPPGDFDFEGLYRSFPRHEGKEQGMKHLAEQVKDGATFADFERAVGHYAALTKKRGTEKKFIKLWSTFVGSKRAEPWRDFIERPAELDESSHASPATDWDSEKARLLREHEELQKRNERVYGVPS